MNKFKKGYLLIIFLIILSATILYIIWIKPNAKLNNNETKHAQIYNQFYMLVANSKPEQLEYQGEITIHNKSYYEYCLNDVTVQVLNSNNEELNIDYIADYNVLYEGNVFTFSGDVPQYPINLTVLYVDINKDKRKDIVVIGEPYTGSNNTKYSFRAIDLTIMDEIEVFSVEDRYLRKLQEEQLLDMLSKDKEFQTIFADMDGINYASIPYIDEFENLYYKLAIGKGLIESTGEILVLFDYNEDTKNFDVIDYIYSGGGY